MANLHDNLKTNMAAIVNKAYLTHVQIRLKTSCEISQCAIIYLLSLSALQKMTRPAKKAAAVGFKSVAKKRNK